MKILEMIAGGFTSWKTTLTGFVAMLFFVFHSFLGFPEVTTDMQVKIVGVVIFLIGYFSKDSTATGKPLDED